MDLKELFDRARQGSVIPAELDAIVAKLNAGQLTDEYLALLIIGRAGHPGYRKSIDVFLLRDDDPQLVALALQILVGAWELLDDYRSVLLAALKGFKWDSEGYVRLQAISTAGECLRRQRDAEILQMVLDIYSDQTERNLIRGTAYSALGRSRGMNWNELPPVSQHRRPVEDIADPAVIDAVKRSLRN